jgi:hypothetical protein
MSHTYFPDTNTLEPDCIAALQHAQSEQLKAQLNSNEQADGDSNDAESSSPNPSSSNVDVELADGNLTDHLKTAQSSSSGQTGETLTNMEGINTETVTWTRELHPETNLGPVGTVNIVSSAKNNKKGKNNTATNKRATRSSKATGDESIEETLTSGEINSETDTSTSAYAESETAATVTVAKAIKDDNLPLKTDDDIMVVIGEASLQPLAAVQPIDQPLDQPVDPVDEIPVDEIATDETPGYAIEPRSLVGLTGKAKKRAAWMNAKAVASATSTAIGTSTDGMLVTEDFNSNPLENPKRTNNQKKLNQKQNKKKRASETISTSQENDVKRVKHPEGAEGGDGVMMTGDGVTQQLLGTESEREPGATSTDGYLRLDSV